MIITDLKQQVKNKNRVSVYIEAQFRFGLTLAQIVDFGLKKGMEISESRLEELKNEAEYGKLRAMAINYCMIREHSVKELRDYLWRKMMREELSESLRDNFRERMIRDLTEKKIIDDARFAKVWAEQRKSRGGVSVKRLKMEMMQKGLDKDLTMKTLGETFGESGERNEAEEIRKMMAKKAKRYAGDRKKLLMYLLRQGFNYDLVKEVVEEN